MGGEVNLDQKGQAIFEFIIFLPFMIFLYSIFYTAGNSINGSINQQKAVRGYYYNLLQGNSYINTYEDLRSLSSESGIRRVGFFAIGWREKEGAIPASSLAPCFSFASFLKEKSDEVCEDTTREIDDKSGYSKSKFIRLFTFYGICGPVYFHVGNDYFDIRYNAQNSIGMCSTGM